MKDESALSPGKRGDDIRVRTLANGAIRHMGSLSRARPNGLRISRCGGFRGVV